MGGMLAAACFLAAKRWTLLWEWLDRNIVLHQGTNFGIIRVPQGATNSFVFLAAGYRHRRGLCAAGAHVQQGGAVSRVRLVAS